MSRIVLLGATGLTGELTARALARHGARPVLAGRRPDALRRLAGELGGLETARADLDAPGAVHELVEAGDVLVSAAGPFTRLGAPAVEAAIERRATYLDCAGEPPFLRAVFERFGPRARAAGCALLPATAFESTAGNLAAELALARAPDATAIEVAYFVTGKGTASAGTWASVAAAALEPGFAFRDGELVRRINGGALRRHGRRGALSAALAEHFTLPRRHPRLRRVDAFTAWYGPAPRAMQLAALGGAPLSRSRRGRRLAAAVAGRALERAPGGAPDAARRARSGCHVRAVARDERGRALARVDLEGIDGYELTGNLLAWAALRAAAGAVRGSGALGPAEAFGLEALRAGCEASGLRLAAAPGEPPTLSRRELP